MNATVFTFVNAVLIRGLPVDDPDRVMALNSRDPVRDRQMGVSYLDFKDWKAASKSFSQLAAYSPSMMNLSDEGRAPERFNGVFISAEAFRILGETPGPRPRLPARGRSARRAAGDPAGRRRLQESLRQRSRRDRADGARQRCAVGRHRRHAGRLQVSDAGRRLAAAVDGARTRAAEAQRAPIRSVRPPRARRGAAAGARPSCSRSASA